MSPLEGVDMSPVKEKATMTLLGLVAPKLHHHTCPAYLGRGAPCWCFRLNTALAQAAALASAGLLRKDGKK